MRTADKATRCYGDRVRAPARARQAGDQRPTTNALLRGSTYSPLRGGHAPGDVRDAFLEAIVAFMEWAEGEPEPTVELCNRPVPICNVCGVLWNCSDTIPRSEWDELKGADPYDELQGHSYAAAARFMKWKIQAPC